MGLKGKSCDIRRSGLASSLCCARSLAPISGNSWPRSTALVTTKSVLTQKPAWRHRCWISSRTWPMRQTRRRCDCGLPGSSCPDISRSFCAISACGCTSMTGFLRPSRKCGTWCGQKRKQTLSWRNAASRVLWSTEFCHGTCGPARLHCFISHASLTWARSPAECAVSRSN